MPRFNAMNTIRRNTSKLFYSSELRINIYGTSVFGIAKGFLNRLLTKEEPRIADKDPLIHLGKTRFTKECSSVFTRHLSLTFQGAAH